jgi:hypothetical protein
MRSAANLAIAPASVPALDVFRLRAWARAYLYMAGEIDLHDAVDVLQDAAETDGLISEIGQGAVQKIIAEAFREVRR